MSFYISGNYFEEGQTTQTQTTEQTDATESGSGRSVVNSILIISLIFSRINLSMRM